jgi:DNA polymerase V
MRVLRLHSSVKLDIFSADTSTVLELPYISEGIRAGFPSPALDFEDVSIDLNKYVVRHPSATFYGRVKGDSMRDIGIEDGDLVVIDRSIEPANGKIAICYIDGEFTIKKIMFDNNCCWLLPANENYEPIKVTKENEFIIWGIVTHVIKAF